MSNRYKRFTDLQNLYNTKFRPPLVFKSLPDSIDIKVHTVQMGEDLPLISYKYFGDPEYWWVIAKFNTILDPFSTKPGDLLNIPTDIEILLENMV